MITHILHNILLVRAQTRHERSGFYATLSLRSFKDLATTSQGNVVITMHELGWLGRGTL